MGIPRLVQGVATLIAKLQASSVAVCRPLPRICQSPQDGRRARTGWNFDWQPRIKRGSELADTGGANVTADEEGEIMRPVSCHDRSENTRLVPVLHAWQRVQAIDACSTGEDLIQTQDAHKSMPPTRNTAAHNG